MGIDIAGALAIVSAVAAITLASFVVGWVVVRGIVNRSRFDWLIIGVIVLGALSIVGELVLSGSPFYFPAICGVLGLLLGIFLAK